MTTEQNIIYTNGNFYVVQIDHDWFGVFAVGNSKRIFSHRGNKALRLAKVRAIAECDRLASDNEYAEWCKTDY